MSFHSQRGCDTSPTLIHLHPTILCSTLEPKVFCVTQKKSIQVSPRQKAALNPSAKTEILVFKNTKSWNQKNLLPSRDFWAAVQRRSKQITHVSTRGSITETDQIHRNTADPGWILESCTPRGSRARGRRHEAEVPRWPQRVLHRGSTPLSRTPSRALRTRRQWALNLKVQPAERGRKVYAQTRVSTQRARELPGTPFKIRFGIENHVRSTMRV